MLIYGAHGAGKTTLAGSAADVPNMADVLLISAEGGEMSLRDNPRVVNIDKVRSIRTTTWKETCKAFEYISSHGSLKAQKNFDKIRQYEALLTGQDVDDIKEPTIYNTVIVDSLTEINAQCMNEV